MSRLLASRRRVFFAALGLLLVLDVGRSILGRLGYAHPTATWQPDPAVYADLTWPPGADLAADVPLGRRVYAQRCAVCHGPDGRGNGPAAPSLIPRPRDFTLGQFKYKSTAAGQPPTEADLMHVVATGLPASAMPYWRDILDSVETRAVVAYVKSMSRGFERPAPAPLAVPPRAAPTAASIARGRALFTTKGCIACHGSDGRARLVQKDAKGYPLVSRDLTAPWTFRGGSEPEQIWLRLTTGLAPGPMPSFAATTTAAERWDLVNYVGSLARIPPWAPGGRLDGPGQQADRVQRGEYLVHAEMCGLCHTAINRTGIYRADDFYLAGGMRVDPHPHPTGEIEVVRTVDAGAVDGRVTQAAHLRVYEVLPPLHAIGLLARTVEPATGCPRRDAGERADVVHQVPPLGRRRGRGERGHRTGGEACRETQPDLLRLAAAAERPRGRQIAGHERVALRVFLDQARPPIGPVTGDAPLGGEQRSTARDARRRRRGTRRHGEGRGCRPLEPSGHALHVRHHRAGLNRVEDVAPVGHGARRQAGRHDVHQVGFRGRLARSGGLVLELAEGEVARARDQ